MTVQQLIDWLNTIEDKSKTIGFRNVLGDFKTIDDLIGVAEWADVVELNNEVVIKD